MGRGQHRRLRSHVVAKKETGNGRREEKKDYKSFLAWQDLLTGLLPPPPSCLTGPSICRRRRRWRAPGGTISA